MSQSFEQSRRGAGHARARRAGGWALLSAQQREAGLLLGAGSGERGVEDLLRGQADRLVGLPVTHAAGSHPQVLDEALLRQPQRHPQSPRVGSGPLADWLHTRRLAHTASVHLSRTSGER